MCWKRTSYEENGENRRSNLLAGARSDCFCRWQNGYMERWFGKFKTEPGPLNQSRDLPQLHVATALQIRYYNHERIHSALGINPAAYAATLQTKAVKEIVFTKGEP